ncbi:MAG: efflux RND transporter periplasmic adaptor subunit [Gemmatimonadota bacterium]
MNSDNTSIRILAALVAVLASTACDGDEPGRVEPASEPVDVEVAAPVEAPGVSGFPATVVSTDEARLATRVSGSIREVRVDVGSVVERGDTLVKLDATDVEAGVARAAAGLRQAEARFERIRNLEADGAATAQELDDARAALETARSNLEEARAQREYVVLRAPFSGVITSRSVDGGDLAMPGSPVLSLVRSASLEVVADLPAAAARRVSAGDRLSVSDLDAGVSHPVTVGRISPALDRSSRRIRVELQFVEPQSVRVAPGSYVRLELSDSDRLTTWVPADAVVRRGQLTGLYVIHDERLELRWVRTGGHRLDAVEVLAGVGPSDRVVRRPAPSLVDGAPVGTVSERSWTPGQDGDR